MTPLNVIFAGTPEFSVPALEAILQAGHRVVAVYTQPDRPAGRGQKLTPSPVKQAAQNHQIPIYQPESLKTEEALTTLQNHQADVMVVVAYGLLLPQAVLETPNYGCLNIHASLLPRWRGAAPIQRAIEAGDAQTGVTIMQMDIGLDTGDMLHKVTTSILNDDTAQILHDRLSALGAKAIVDVLAQLPEGTLTAEPQDDNQATYAKKLTKAEAELDWTQPAKVLQRKVQAFNPWPVAFTQLNNKPLRIWQAQAITETELEINNASHENFKKTPESPVLPGTILDVNKLGIDVQTGDGILRLKHVQPSGKKAMNAYDFAQARQLIKTRLGQ